MATYKRWHGRKITADHPQWKRARWTVEFVLKGRRVIQAVPEARTQAQAERAESQLREDGKAETPRNDLRSGSTVNRYMALLSGVCKRAIKEEFMSANPCSQIDEEPENSRARYRTIEEQIRLFDVLKGDLGFLNAPITVSLGTGLRKQIELLMLKVEHLNFSSRPVFYPVRGGSA